MTELSDPIQGDTWAFTFYLAEPRPATARRLVVLLHGVGGEPAQMAGLAGLLGDDTLVVMPRGHRTISGERLGWFREALGEDHARIVEDEAAEACAKLADFIEHLQARYDVPPSRTLLAGFSQGGMLAAMTALATPARVAGFVMACGRVPPEVAGDIERRRGLRALVLHGRHDDVLPPDWATQADALLASHGITHELRLFDGGHAWTPALEKETAAWLNEPTQPWNR